MHANSIRVYNQDKYQFKSRTDRIVEFLERRGPATDRQVAEWFGKSDPNYVRPRITEAIKRGRLVEVGETIDTETGKRVRLVTVRKATGQPVQRVMFGGVA